MFLFRGLDQQVPCIQGLTVVFRGFFEILFHAFARVVTFTEAEDGRRDAGRVL